MEDKEYMQLLYEINDIDNRLDRLTTSEFFKKLLKCLDRYLKAMEPLRYSKQIVPLSPDIIDLLYWHTEYEAMPPTRTLEVSLSVESRLAIQFKISGKVEVRNATLRQAYPLIREVGERIRVRPSIRRYWKSVVRFVSEYQIPILTLEKKVKIGKEIVNIKVGNSDHRIRYVYYDWDHDHIPVRFKIARIPCQALLTARRLGKLVIDELSKVEQENERLIRETTTFLRPILIAKGIGGD